MEPDTSRAIGARQGSGPSHMLPTLTVNLSARAHSLLAETGIATSGRHHRRSVLESTRLLNCKKCKLIIYVVNIIPLNPHIDTAQPFASPPSHVSSSGLLLLI